jgi:cell division protein FtsL
LQEQGAVVVGIDQMNRDYNNKIIIIIIIIIIVIVIVIIIIAGMERYNIQEYIQG